MPPKFEFVKAEKCKSLLRMFIAGPSGSGKTYTALTLATAIGGRIGVIDTEDGSSAKYGKLFKFEVLELTDHSPESYMEALKYAESQGFDIIIIDSLSHAWKAALERVDEISKRSKTGNSFSAWGDVTPLWDRLLKSLTKANAHVIATSRSKTEYILEAVEKNGRTTQVPKKVGMAPILRDGAEYEFDVTGEMTLDNDLIIGKTRVPALKRKLFHEPGKELADILVSWLNDGSEVAPDYVAQARDTLKSLGCKSASDYAAVIDYVVSLKPEDMKDPDNARQFVELINSHERQDNILDKALQAATHVENQSNGQ